MSPRTPAAAVAFTVTFALAVLVVVLRIPDARLGPFVVTAGFGAVALALLAALGHGLEGWLPGATPLPGWVGAALFGYVALTVAVAAVQTSLCGSRPALLGLGAVALGGAAWRIVRRPGGPVAAEARRDGRLAAAFTAAALVAAAVPAAGIGESLPLVGENADFALYTTLARWWQDVSAHDLPLDPRFRDRLLPDGGGYGLQVGFATVVHYLTALSLATGRQPLDVFLAGMVALRALAAGAVWLLCRRGLGWDAGRAAAAAALSAVCATATAAPYYCFANQTAGLVLLPLALLGWIELLDRPGAGAALRASLGIAAVAGGYAPLLPYLALASILLLAVRLVRGSNRPAMVGFAAAVAIAALLLAPGLRGALLDLAGQVRYWRPGGGYAGAWGSVDQGFVAAPGWLGLWPGAGAPPPEPGSVWRLVLGATAWLAIAAITRFLLGRGDGDGRARALVLALALLLLGLRLFPFAHGFNKSTVSLQFVAAIAVVAGLTGLSARPGTGAVLCLAFGLTLGATSAATLVAVAEHRVRGLSPRVRELAEVVAGLPSGASLLVEEARSLGPRLASVLGVLATPDIDLAGQAETYYFRFFTPPRGDEDHVLLLSPRPPPLGFAIDPIAVVGRYRIHRGLDRVLRRTMLARSLRVSDDTVVPHLEDLPAGSVVLAELMAGGRVTIACRDGASPGVVLPAGAHRLAVGRTGEDGELQLSADGGPVWVTAVAVLAAGRETAPAAPEALRTDVVLAEASAAEPGGLTVEVLTVAGGSGWPATLRLEVRGSAAGGRQWRLSTRVLATRGGLEVHRFDLADFAARAQAAEPAAPVVQVTVSAVVGDGTPRGRERIALASFLVTAGEVRELSTEGFVRRAP